MTPDQLLPGMWVTVRDPIVEEITGDDTPAENRWRDSGDELPNLTHSWKAGKASIGITLYQRYAGRPLLVNTVDDPFVYTDVLGMTFEFGKPPARNTAILDLRLVALMPLSTDYVDAVIESMIAHAPRDENGEALRAVQSYFDVIRQHRETLQRRRRAAR